jgi:ketosteroid isomerase-like protein
VRRVDVKSENERLARHVIDLFNRGEIDEALELVDDGFELDWSNSIGVLKGVYRGREAARELWKSFFEMWDDVNWEPEEIIEVDESRLILAIHVRMRGRDGIEVEATSGQLWTLGEGRGQSIKLYQSKDEALEAVRR